MSFLTSWLQKPSENVGEPRMNMNDLANLLDSDGNLQNEMMVAAFAATMLATIPVLLGNEFDVNVGLKRKKRSPELELEQSIRRHHPKFARYSK